jgi:hypothetical protein
VPSYRYIKSRYKRLYIKRELYEKLQALAEKEGLTVPSLIEKLYIMYISPNITPNIQHNISPNTAGQSLTMSINPNIRGNITPNTAPVDMIRNAKRLEDWLRESRLLY